jgi:hypothetical protein
LEVSLPAATLTIPILFKIRVNFDSEKRRLVRLFDFQGKVHNQVLTQNQAIKLSYTHSWLYVVQVQVGSNYWVKKIWIEYGGRSFGLLLLNVT